ncbi:MAG: 4-hydroxy-3-methylbut-2-enyl diphosphate reductase [Gammaproteobacteria bacterium]|nr:MAG: 4-hydroxy-3-methylbut-2-enyl diphosphate reductase [Gammaproteobacteria bacterium]|tara:strand:+ start:84 stop:1025 length:942 start_codon:yes stop_codon:yes gene_type:complete
MSQKTIKLANPRGFCAGVDRAIDIVNIALDKFGPPVYVRHEVVHNRKVVQDLKLRGARFVDNLDEVPEKSIAIFSAHGVSEKVESEAKKYNLNYFDATCPLVTKVHMEVIKYADQGRDIIMIGHKNHPEVEGTLGRFPSSSEGKIYLVESELDAKTIEIKQPDNLSLVTQTTLSVDDTKKIIEILEERFPNIKAPNADDICYATQNRQDAVKQLALETEFIIVVGSENSSNSNRLKELAELMGTKSCLVDHVSQISEDTFRKVNRLGITSGASAPEELVKEIVSYCESFGFSKIEELDGLKENVSFNLPKELR